MIFLGSCDLSRIVYSFELHVRSVAIISGSGILFSRSLLRFSPLFSSGSFTVSFFLDAYQDSTCGDICLDFLVCPRAFEFLSPIWRLGASGHLHLYIYIYMNFVFAYFAFVCDWVFETRQLSLHPNYFTV